MAKIVLTCQNLMINKGHMDKIKGEGGVGGGRWVKLGWGGGMGRKRHTTVIE